MSIYKKLFEAKKEIGTITKDAKNPFFKSNYLSLNGLIDAVEPILEKHGLLLLQPISSDCVHTEIVDIEEPSTRIQSYMKLPNIQDPQKLGSAITYYRRYTLQSLLGTKAQDDDGNTATKQVKVERKVPTEWITDKAMESLTLPENKKHIPAYIKKFKLRPEQREVLQKLIEICS